MEIFETPPETHGCYKALEKGRLLQHGELGVRFNAGSSICYVTDLLLLTDHNLSA